VLNPLVFLVAQMGATSSASGLRPIEFLPWPAIIVVMAASAAHRQELAAARVILIDRGPAGDGGKASRRHSAIAGNGVSSDTLKAAAVETAKLIYITVPDGFEAGRIVEIARQLNPGIRIFARSHNDAEIDHLNGFGADVIISGEEEIAQAMGQIAQKLGLAPKKSPFERTAGAEHPRPADQPKGADQPKP
jgi:CPA2 family monovalent cation:H+ antiporter-2